MDNKALMSILAQLQKNHNQKQVLYFMGGTIFIGGMIMFYLHKQNTALSNNIKSLTGINESLAARAEEQEQEISQNRYKINQLEKNNQQLSQTINSMRQEKQPPVNS